MNVCHDGDQKKWGQREAITACRQLNYKGGWPITMEQREISTKHLNNFDCDECKFILPFILLKIYSWRKSGNNNCDKLEAVEESVAERSRHWTLVQMVLGSSPTRFG